jgi:hypothetical protein
VLAAAQAHLLFCDADLFRRYGVMGRPAIRAGDEAWHRLDCRNRSGNLVPK